MKGDAYLPRNPKTTEHETPDDFFDNLNNEFRFTLDAAASHINAKIPFYFTKEQNSLIQPWKNHRVWLNPPFGHKELKAFTDKILDENCLVVMLVPPKVDQSWFHKLVAEQERYEWFKSLSGVQQHAYLSKTSIPPRYIEFRWIKGRLTFVGSKDTFPTAVFLIVIHPRVNRT